MNRLTFSEAQQQLLQAQVINADQPGPVLRDFQTVLDYVGAKGIKGRGQI